ncbi:hypothetical protein S245_020527, partial [Arachis hypogaea]
KNLQDMEDIAIILLSNKDEELWALKCSIYYYYAFCHNSLSQQRRYLPLSTRHNPSLQPVATPTYIPPSSLMPHATVSLSHLCRANRQHHSTVPLISGNPSTPTFILLVPTFLVFIHESAAGSRRKRSVASPPSSAPDATLASVVRMVSVEAINKRLKEANKCIQATEIATHDSCRRSQARRRHHPRSCEEPLSCSCRCAPSSFPHPELSICCHRYKGLSLEPRLSMSFRRHCHSSRCCRRFGVAVIGATSGEKRASDEVHSLSERVQRLQASLGTIQSAKEVRELRKPLTGPDEKLKSGIMVSAFQFHAKICSINELDSLSVQIFHFVLYYFASYCCTKLK